MDNRHPRKRQKDGEKLKELALLSFCARSAPKEIQPALDSRREE